MRSSISDGCGGSRVQLFRDPIASGLMSRGTMNRLAIDSSGRLVGIFEMVCSGASARPEGTNVLSSSVDGRRREVGSSVDGRASASGSLSWNDLSRGFRQAVLDTPLVVGKVGDREAVLNAPTHPRRRHRHALAAYTIVPESVAEPLKYYGNNTCSTRNLLECCVDAGRTQLRVFSTAAVYGIPAEGYAAEDTATAPIHPYGTSKLMSEWMLRDVAAASPMKYVALRYFNVAGSDTGGRVGQATPKATLLVKVAVEAAVGKRPHVSIFGTDYATPDGTGIRDYIHVEDLATAQLGCARIPAKRRRLHRSERGLRTRIQRSPGAGECRASGRQTTQRQGGAPPAGDPPALVARADRIRAELGWRPRLDDLDTIVTTALKWEQRLLQNPW